MATINFYLDKPDKKGLSPIHLRINCNGGQVKISTCEKVKAEQFDKEKQLLRGNSKQANSINHYLRYLRERSNEMFDRSLRKTFTNKEIKDTLRDYIQAYKSNNQVSIVREQVTLYGKPYTFVDLFAGAGGFSEGFLQAEYNNKYFDFVVANDINDNCELTHIVRYNHQLGLDAKFLCQDITEPDFLDNLLEKVGGRSIDVVCGGPPCQSFSLAGKRKMYDKKDDLFSHYLEVIKILQPKYFVMENVKGILTKENGKIKKRILDEIRSIVDIQELPKLERFVKDLTKRNPTSEFILDCLIRRVDFERFKEKELDDAREAYIKVVEAKFRLLTPRIVDYKTSKTDVRVSTIRHGFNLLLRRKQIQKLQRDIIREKDFCNVDNDYFVEAFTDFLSELNADAIITKVRKAFQLLEVPKQYAEECESIIVALEIYTMTFEGCVDYITQFCDDENKIKLAALLGNIRLYKIDSPFVANASNYGVPQNRERVLFIGCRKDQKLINDIPPTVSENNKVTVFEALHDLDFVGNNEEAHQYKPVDVSLQFNGTSEIMNKLIRKRSIDGKNGKTAEKTYAEWSRGGRFNGRFKDMSSPFYVRDINALNNGERVYDVLHNHKTSKQNADVISRLKIILESGNYVNAKKRLKECGLSSQKRNYSVLKPEGQSPTVMTIADDYIHYNAPRALTVREMARLQSFDDSFVFQGKRSTGGNKRKSEVPQYTLVGNAVPPLLARAVAMEILKRIK